MALTSQLDAVNIIVGTVGEAPLNTLDNKALTSDATVAVRLLDEVSRQVQSTGWSFNTDRKFTFTRSTDNTVTLPSNVLRVNFDRLHHWDNRPVVRGSKLYDQKNQTFTWTADVIAHEVIWYFTWDQLPETARRYITIKSARMFADRQGGGNEVRSYTEQDELEAKRDFEKDEGEASNLNIFTADGVQRIVNRRAPWAW